ncbi:hypothetical protein C1H46_002038 [Malus baccata]|uniref:Uncharacterized protein n=1 Tax=Malus baccata TaxID=106549 RepID=A0A540NMY6_MALBA|nr:hypothetical protein C1H46_002038 [Malus baccata]
MVCRASVLAQARVFLTPPPSLGLPLMAVLLVALHGLLSSGSQNSFSGCLISSLVAVSQVMLEVGCDDRRVSVWSETWIWATLDRMLRWGLLLHSRVSFLFWAHAVGWALLWFVGWSILLVYVLWSGPLFV